MLLQADDLYVPESRCYAVILNGCGLWICRILCSFMPVDISRDVSGDRYQG